MANVTISGEQYQWKFPVDQYKIRSFLAVFKNNKGSNEFLIAN